MVRIPDDKYEIIQHTHNPLRAEQDYMECLIIRYLLSDSKTLNDCVLSGGSSISRAYQISHRVCNDIDFACVGFRELTDNRTIRQLKNFRRDFKDFVFTDIFTRVNYAINQISGIRVLTDRQYLKMMQQPNTQSGTVLHLLCDSKLSTTPHHINIEIIPRKYHSGIVAEHSVAPYYTPTTPVGTVPTVSYEQTFWDKVYALHIIASGSDALIRPALSRHFYDVAKIQPYIKISQTWPMLLDVARYQKIYTTRDTPILQRLSDINIIPDTYTLGKLETDYNTFIIQNIREYHAWSDIIAVIQKLNTNIKKL